MSTIVPLEGFCGGGNTTNPELRIVGGTTRPTKATQNMIWINTGVEITSYALSATEPKNPVEGMVWITIGNSGVTKSTSPVGDEWITVYPLSASQYISGAWTSKPAMSYQFGEWVDWVNYLYKSGNEYADITGGWQFVSTRTGCTLGAYTNNGKSITLNGSSSAMQSTSYCTKKAVDLTDLTKLWINVTELSGQYIWFKAGTAVSMANGATRSSNLLTGHNYIDVSNLNGLYYIAVEVYSDKAVNGSVTFDKIWKE